MQGSKEGDIFHWTKVTSTCNGKVVVDTSACNLIFRSGDGTRRHRGRGPGSILCATTKSHGQGYTVNVLCNIEPGLCIRSTTNHAAGIFLDQTSSPVWTPAKDSRPDSSWQQHKVDAAHPSASPAAGTYRLVFARLLHPSYPLFVSARYRHLVFGVSYRQLHDSSSLPLPLRWTKTVDKGPTAPYQPRSSQYRPADAPLASPRCCRVLVVEAL